MTGRGRARGKVGGWGQKCLFLKRYNVADSVKKGTMNVVRLAQMKEDKRINSAVHAKVLKFGLLDLVGILII